MVSDRIVASLGIRIAATGMVVASITAFTFSQRAGNSGSGNWLFVVGLVAAVLATMGLILSSRPVYDVWMKFAGVLHTIITVALFGVVYLILVPFIVVFVRVSVPLELGRRAARDETFWIRRKKDEDRPESFQRMG